MDCLQQALQLQTTRDLNQDQPRDPKPSLPLHQSQIKPIISSRVIWTVSGDLCQSRLRKASPESFTHIVIKQRDAHQITLSDMKNISKVLNNKCIHTLSFKITGYNSPQLKILADKLRRLNHLKALTVDFTWYTLNQGTKTFLSFPKHLKDLTNLKLHFKYETWSLPALNSYKFNFGLKSFKFLTSLHYDVSNLPNIRAQDLEVFSTNLKDCQYLQSLTLDFESCLYMPNKAVHRVTAVFRHLQYLRKVNINFSRCHKLNHKAARNLANSLNLLSNLSSLTLNFNECQKIDSTAVCLLSKAVRNHNNLRTLDFTFPFYENVSEGINIFLKELVHVQPLISLKLHIPSSHIKIREDFVKNLSQALQAQSRLELLSIKLKHAEIQGLWTKHLAEGFSALRSLSKLFFKFKYSKGLNDKNADGFGEAIGKLKNLSALKLNLYDHNFTQEGTRKIFDGIKALKNLHKFSLNLGKHHLTSSLVQQVKSLIPFEKSSEIRTLNLALNTMHQKLQVLKLELILVNSAAKDLFSFSKHLSSLEQLTTLHLGFAKASSSKILQKGLEDVFSSFKNIPKLTDLAVTVHNGSDQDLNSLLICLEDCKELRSLLISFPEENMFPLETAHKLFKSMKKLEKIYKLRLNICFKTNLVQDVPLILAGIKQLKSLLICQFFFGKTEIDFLKESS